MQRSILVHVTMTEENANKCSVSLLSAILYKQKSTSCCYLLLYSTVIIMMSRYAFFTLMRRQGLMKIRHCGAAYYYSNGCHHCETSSRTASNSPVSISYGYMNGKKKNSSATGIFGFATVAAASTFTSACDEDNGGLTPVQPPTRSNKKTAHPSNHPDDRLLQIKPLWPDGVSEADVDALVEVILQDPSINIALIPDSIEAVIYKSAIRLTLNIFYRLLSRLNGVSLLSHQIQVARTQQTNHGNESLGIDTILANKNYQRIAAVAQNSNSMVNDQVLEIIAERLLANRAINNTMVPDVIEIQLYKNCLKVIFRALQILSNSFCINICGHDIQLSIEPSYLEQSALTATASSSSNLRMSSDIDMELLKEFALRGGIPNDGSVELSWWDEVLGRRQFVANLHASLYSLVLGIVDDVSNKWPERLQ